MRAPLALAAFAAAMAVVFVTALGVGQVIGPIGGSPPAGEQDAVEHDAGGHDAVGHEEQHTPAVGGLGITADGYALVAERTEFTTGETSTLRFVITGNDGDPVTAFALNHDRPMHLVLLRRDLSGYQHLHPVMASDGVWSVPVRLEEPGSYRAFADFVPAGRGRALALGVDLIVPGDAGPHALPDPATTAAVDDYTVALDGTLGAGEVDTLRFTVARGGAPVTDLQPYLGALGHLVVVRAGDLGYVHVHPVDGLAFQAGAPSRGTYRLFLDFQHEDRVRTAEFTAVVGGGAA